MQRAVMANILRKIADAIEKYAGSDLDDFDIELRPRKIRGKITPMGATRSQSPYNHEELERLWEQLKDASTREGASEILDGFELTRKELEVLARRRSVHVTKDDNVSRIKEKLVEAVIGSRLNSLAIRGKQEQ